MNFEQAKIILIDLHLNSASFQKPDVVDKAAYLFSLFEDDFVQRTNNETFYNLPYKEISVRIFESDINEVPSNTLDGFSGTVKEKLNDEYKHKSNDINHLLKCYEKFTHHIELAFIQKQFIQKASKDALIIAQKAEDLANEADSQAKSTIANYISILGIFASIIFTLFGGVNLIGSTVKLLETGSRWPYLIFIISLLMICLLTLLNMMVKWINSMSNLKRALEKEEVNNSGKLPFKFLNPCTWDFYTKAVFCFFVVLLISMYGMYHVKKEEFKSHTKEITSQMESSKREEKSSKNTDTQSNKPSMTIVEKTTVANHLPSSKDDKDD